MNISYNKNLHHQFPHKTEQKIKNLVKEPFQSRPDHGESFLILEKGNGLLTLLHDVHLDVVLKVLAYSREMSNWRMKNCADYQVSIY